MIRMIQSRSAGHAKEYFNEALLKADYYLHDQEMNGRFQGKLADRLGITGPATREAFHDLCENIHPVTGAPLTQRTVEQRTVGYDINFHVPKSVSVLHVLSKDDHVLNAFQESVRDTMREIETDSLTRVRKSGTQADRETGELLWADFIHQTARPVDGSVPDPHLHAHCFTFNATWDREEQAFKAVQFRDIKRDMPYYQAKFHKNLSDRLMGLGYGIRRTEKSFEVDGVPQEVIDLFSKRTNEIGQVAKEKGITDAKELDGLGARTRSKKQKGLSMAELKKEWKRQIAVVEKTRQTDGDKVIRYGLDREEHPLTPAQCLDHTLEHCFERASVMQDRRLLAESFRHAIGHRTVTADHITEALKADSRIIRVKEGRRTVCTTKAVLAEEQRMVALARKGKGALHPLYKKEPKISLEGEQGEAVRHILTTTDRVSIIRGRAGTGKTTLMKEAVSLIEEQGKTVTVVAPTSQASRGVLKDEGFKDATTVAGLLVDQERQDALNGQVLWVDEAGLLGTGDMTSLLHLAEEKNARLILSGDTRQHASVVRGDALRILNTVAGIKTAEISRIYRQRNQDYREAVQDLSDGKIKSAFEKLDGMGAVKTVDPLKPNETLVEDYISCVKKGKSALIVSPTHKQGEAVTAEVRKKLKEAGKIGKREITIPRLSGLNLTEAEKLDKRSYQPGQKLVFSQNLKGIKRGSVWEIDQIGKERLSIRDKAGNTHSVSLDQARNFDVFRESQIGLAKGDTVRITRNGFDQENKRLNNGQILEVMSVKKKGPLTLRNVASKAEYTVPQEFHHLAHAHCVTSHASQGKTVDEVFIAQPSGTFPATDMKQFYVSVSRGRNRVHLYTDDREALLDHASRMGDRESALELVARKKDRTLDRAEQISRNKMEKEKSPEPGTKQKSPEKSSSLKTEIHGPEPEI